MKSKSPAVYIPETIRRLIFTLRGQKIILDSDLAALYGVATKVLNQAIKRNAEKFPVDFMFQLAPQEVKNLRLQIVTSSLGHGGRRYVPLAFTEHGAIMAATVLSSPQAVQMSVFVVRAFVAMRLVSPPTTLRRGRRSWLPRRARRRGPPERHVQPDCESPRPPTGFDVKEKSARYGTKMKRA
ncbi:MAG: ORF6N domain-containing protein [Kiritimatiellia bacterium]